MCFFGLLIIGQIIKVQFYEGEKWSKKAMALTTKYHTIEAVRGNIFAEDGSLISTSLPIYEVRMDMRAGGLNEEIFNEKIDSLAAGLAELFPDKTMQQFRSELNAARKKKERYHLIRRGVRYTELKKMKTLPLFRLGRHSGGIIYIQQNKREQPFKNLAIRTIGYDRANAKPVGIEGAYNDFLVGIQGKRLMQKISGGNWMPINDDNEIEPHDGCDIVTTIDINIQDVAQHALKTQLIKSKADHGCVVLMEVATGKVKAIANLTKIDSVNYSEQYNYAIGESTYPGSTLKLASYMAAIEDGYIHINDTVDIEGGKKQFKDRTVKDSHPKENRLSVKKAFEVSSNVAVAKLIYKHYGHNPKKFTDHLNAFGLGKQLGIELPGEGIARIKTPKDKDWYGTTLPWLAHGYESQLTPLQLLVFYNSVANNGKMVKPLFVERITRKGETIKEFNTTVIKESICSDNTLKQVKKMLEGVVDNGTAKNLKNNYLKIAGKTGTAVLSGFAKNADDNDNSNKKYQASFVGYFPADEPKYSCVIVINNPSHKSFYGNVVAGPIFREIADKVYATNLKIQQELKKDTIDEKYFTPIAKSGKMEDFDEVITKLALPSNKDKVSAEWVTANNNGKKIALKQLLVGKSTAPNVVGMGLRDAVYLLENKGFQVVVKGKGMVVKQSVKPGSIIEKNQTIMIELI